MNWEALFAILLMLSITATIYWMREFGKSLKLLREAGDMIKKQSEALTECERQLINALTIAGIQEERE